MAEPGDRIRNQVSAFGDFRNIRLQRDSLHAERPHFGGERLGFGDPAVIIDCEVSAFLPPMQCRWRDRCRPAANEYLGHIDPSAG